MNRVLVVVMLVALSGTACSPTPDADVTVTLVEHVIGMPVELPAGTTVIELTNVGAAHHNFTICPGSVVGACNGPGVETEVLVKPEQARDPSIIPERSAGVTIGAGWTAILSADLEPGTYRVFCGVIGHASRGMQRLVTVTAS